MVVALSPIDWQILSEYDVYEISVRHISCIYSHFSNAFKPLIIPGHISRFICLCLSIGLRLVISCIRGYLVCLNPSLGSVRGGIYDMPWPECFVCFYGGGSIDAVQRVLSRPFRLLVHSGTSDGYGRVRRVLQGNIIYYRIYYWS